jgi:hypothetical protein
MRFVIDEDRISRLSATRQGRISIGGFLYQAGYGVARLASMLVGRTVLDEETIPSALRYDWAEDIDEISLDGRVLFTQCEKTQDIGKPSRLASVLLGFAPKLLWTRERDRHVVSFRLVCSDRTFAVQDGFALQELLDGLKDYVFESALRRRFTPLVSYDMIPCYGHRGSTRSSPMTVGSRLPLMPAGDVPTTAEPWLEHCSGSVPAPRAVPPRGRAGWTTWDTED